MLCRHLVLVRFRDMSCRVETKDQLADKSTQVAKIHAECTRSAMQVQSLEISTFSLNSEVRHLEGKCLQLSNEVLRLSEEQHKSHEKQQQQRKGSLQHRSSSRSISRTASIDSNSDCSEDSSANSNRTGPAGSPSLAFAEENVGDSVEPTAIEHPEEETEDFDSSDSFHTLAQYGTEGCVCVGLGDLLFGSAKSSKTAFRNNRREGHSK